MTSTVHWDLDIYALSSISHKDDSTSTTTALFRREEVIQPDGTGELVPIISGNSFRGTLRRIGEELLRDVLDYEGTLSLPAAHTLRSGGALRKTKGEPLSGNRLEHARNLIPLIGVFGGNSSSTMIKGRAQIGKVVPRVKETEHIMSRPSKLPLLSQFELLGIERYSRFDDSDTADFPSTAAAESDAESPATGSHLMRYEVETLPAGTTFESWIRLTRATDLQIAFFTDVLARIHSSRTTRWAIVDRPRDGSRRIHTIDDGRHHSICGGLARTSAQCPRRRAGSSGELVMRPLLVKARLAHGIAHAAPWGVSLDGLLAAEIWADQKAGKRDRGEVVTALAADVDPEDLDLPLARCELSGGGLWHWAATCAYPEKPVDHPVVRYWTGRPDHAALGDLVADLPGRRLGKARPVPVAEHAVVGHEHRHRDMAMCGRR